jgi:hypothetical protein
MTTNARFYKNQLNRFIQKWHVVAEYHSKADDTRWPIRLHVGKYREVETIGDIDQRQRKGIISVLDINELATAPQDGDKVYYLDQITTIDAIDPRIEVGEIIGYDLMLRGT